MKEYDIRKAFDAIERELIASMIRNLKHHRAEETKQGFKWEMWQVKQLEVLERYKKDNKSKFNKQFSNINNSIEELIRMAKQEGGMKQEIAILKAMKQGFQPKTIPQRIKKWFEEMKRKSLGEIIDAILKRNTPMRTSGDFFKVNDRKLNALIEATQNDFKKAEYAMLRMAEDQYRQIIFNAQVYANAGGTTYEKAVDMATKDFLSRGINCIEYKNGARHRISDYADMAIRTANKRAYLIGEGEKRKEWGISLVIVNKRGNPCPKCLPFCGKILIDDVWSGGSKEDGNYPLMSQAIAKGLYHPRCKDVHSTYFEGISTPPEKGWTQEEIDELESNYKKEQYRKYAKQQEEKYSRLAEFSLDKENKKKYAKKKQEWSE